MSIRKVHCLFEQSGTFKNEFIKLGIPAEDYDILNDFGETDHVIDLFKEIRGGYLDEPSIFDEISKDDLIMAFFPCIRFEDQIVMGFKGRLSQMSGWDDAKKLTYDIKLHNELHEMYVRITELALIAYKRGLQLVIENPCGTLHYLSRYWSLEPDVIDKDRRLRGDYYKKPTQYWFINIKPANRLLYEAMSANSVGTIEGMTGSYYGEIAGMQINRSKARSMIHPDYANRFIREYIL